MKYIIFEDFSGKKAPILFPERILHQELWEQLPYSRLFSAGKVYWKNNQFVCQGEAKDLGVRSDSGDAQIIANFFSEPDD